ncbi:MBL fold metallo-hydrolase [Enterobacteriaceae endosymbiont of Donacia bicoloricornis]|uniref:MBL fold metallo-hydrolase n=1 Tax=Enterobacteriaceae endosymbiont of Donacia bicoloricornis TaxID=2675772 RepID=UPI00144971A0|nr:MBL fold metallo-hydrolase [Enterobacteriaceae endosymbiont of Donacia bicoloricornis]QJC37807.1 MBL fold metallo-hydrolase [Enterobacteriaceae endosymbiont of Donacia bicoloricornis]
MNYLVIPVTNFNQNCYIIWCKKTLSAALIDPGGEYLKILKILNKYKLNIVKILITHCHLDHIGAAYVLSEILNIPILGPHKKDIFWIKNLKLQNKLFQLPSCIFKKNIWLKNYQKIYIGKIIFQTYHCPGHTPGHVIFFNKLNNILVSGDTILKNSIGRTDLPKSNFNILINSIKQKILSLGMDTLILPGHGEKTYIYYELMNNPWLKNYKTNYF